MGNTQKIPRSQVVTGKHCQLLNFRFQGSYGRLTSQMNMGSRPYTKITTKDIWNHGILDPKKEATFFDKEDAWCLMIV